MPWTYEEHPASRPDGIDPFLLQQTLEQLPLVTYALDPVTLEPFYFSERVEQLLGYRAAKMIAGGAEFLRGLVHPDDIDELIAEMERWHTAGMPDFGTRRLRCRLRRADGTWLWVEAAMRLSEHEPRRVQGFLIDVDHIVRTKKRTQELLGQFESAFSNARLGIGVVTLPERRLVKVNAMFAEIVGRPEDELLGMAAKDFSRADYAIRTQPFFDEIHLGLRDSWSGENLLRRPDGEYRKVRLTVTGLGAGKDGRELAMVVIEDVTGSDEERAAMLDAQLTTLVNTVPIALALLDTDGHYLRVNDRLAEINQLAPEEHMGRSFRDVVEGPALEAAERLFKKALRGEPATELLSTHVPSLPHAIHALVSMAPVETGDGEIIGVAGAILDQTEQVELQQEAERSRSLEALGRLAGGIAHDFNNILTAIQIATDLVLAKTTDPASQAELRAASNAAVEGSSLIKRLLAFARQQTLAPTTVDLNDVVRNVEVILERLIGEEIELSIEAATEPVIVRADPSQLSQVVLNLVLNARDALQDGGEIKIAVETIDLDELEADKHNLFPGTYARLQVSDTGIGMDEETRRRAFEPFFTTKWSGGSGLGLATVYGIVAQSAGAVQLESEQGVGTSVAVIWPIYSGTAEPVFSQPELPMMVVEKPRVLLVEDEPAVRLLVSSLLEQRGYEHLAAVDGSEALQLLEGGERFGALLTDVRMPHLGGGELAQMARAIQPELPVVFISGYASDARVQDQLRHRATSFLEKPFDADSLERAIAKVLLEAQP